jgi:ComF family protein
LNDTLDELFPSALTGAVREAERDGWVIDGPERYCRRCGANTGPGCTSRPGCPRCLGRPIAWDGVIRLSAYSEPMCRWIVGMKFAGAWAWGPWLGRRLGESVAAAVAVESGTRRVVCPVPMHWARRLHRGYNQAGLIASAMARRLDWPVVHILRRVRYTRPQVGIAPSQRPANIRRSIATAIAGLDLTGWDIWLVDDVKTTGSTLTACARLLRRAGARRVFVAVAAVADPLGADFEYLASPAPMKTVPIKARTQETGKNRVQHADAAAGSLP